MARIVICEEDATLRDLLRAVLESAGHRSLCLTRFEDLAPTEPDLLLLDPGWVVASEQGRRCRDRWPDIPIILTSNLVLSTMDIEALRPFACLPQAFGLTDVREAVARALQPQLAKLLTFPTS
jgi:DNA-binding response OmpR family regulator